MTIQQIVNEIYQPELLVSPQNMVDTFERLKPLIESATFESEDEFYTAYTRLNADYSIALTKVQNYEQAIPNLSKSISLLLNDKKLQSVDLRRIEFYKELLYHRTLCYWNTKRYRKATSDAKNLSRLFPNNRDYSQLYNLIITTRLKRLTNILWFMTGGLLMIEIILKKTGHSYYWALWAGTFFLICVSVIEMVRFYFRKANIHDSR